MSIDSLNGILTGGLLGPLNSLVINLNLGWLDVEVVEPSTPVVSASAQSNGTVDAVTDRYLFITVRAFGRETKRTYKLSKRGAEVAASALISVREGLTVVAKLVNKLKEALKVTLKGK